MTVIVAIIIIAIVSFCFCFLSTYTSSNTDLYATKINSKSLQQMKILPNHIVPLFLKALGGNESRISPHNITDGNLNTYLVHAANKIYSIKYQITGGKVNTINASFSENSYQNSYQVSIHVLISPASNGTFVIEAPRTLLANSILHVLENQNPSSIFYAPAFFDIIKSNASAITIAIDFEKSTKQISIVTQPIPNYEFNNPILAYRPEISVARITGKQSPDAVIPIVANVTDKFGKIQYVNLTYSILNKPYDKHAVLLFRNDEVGTRQGRELLIWGIPSNGSYEGTFSHLRYENATVHYFIKVKDDLGYNNTVDGFFVTGKSKHHDATFLYSY